MLQEDYVSFETAKKLKEKGFPQDCRFGQLRYSVDGERYIPQESNCEFCCACPTLSLVQKWFREEKKIYLDVISETNGKWENGVVYEFSIMKQGLDNLEIDLVIYDTYEEALSAGINKALELI